jgi:hypothetical protein
VSPGWPEIARLWIFRAGKELDEGMCRFSFVRTPSMDIFPSIIDNDNQYDMIVNDEKRK